MSQKVNVLAEVQTFVSHMKAGIFPNTLLLHLLGVAHCQPHSSSKKYKHWGCMYLHTHPSLMYDNVLFLSSPCTQVQRRQLRLATKLQKLCGEVFGTLPRKWAWNSALVNAWSTSLTYALCLFLHNDVAHKVTIQKNECLNFDVLSHKYATLSHVKPWDRPLSTLSILHLAPIISNKKTGTIWHVFSVQSSPFPVLFCCLALLSLFPLLSWRVSSHCDSLLQPSCL